MIDTSLDPSSANQFVYLVRTDFSDEALWQHLLDDMNNVRYESTYDPGVTVVDEPVYNGVTPEQLRRELPEGSRGVAIADATALTSPQHLILMTPYSPDDTPFRVPANAIGFVVSPLVVGRLFWWELALDVGDDGIIDVGISPFLATTRNDQHGGAMSTPHRPATPTWTNSSHMAPDLRIARLTGHEPRRTVEELGTLQVSVKEDQ